MYKLNEFILECSILDLHNTLIQIPGHTLIEVHLNIFVNDSEDLQGW